MTYTYVEREEWTFEPNGWEDGSPATYGGPLDPQDVETCYLHYPGDGVGVRHARLDWNGTKRLINAYRDWHQDGRGWSDIGYPWGATQDGKIIELAGGEFISAHTGGQNTKAVAILLILGDDERPSAKMIAAVKAFIKHLRETQFPHMRRTRPHRDAPGAATPCPGDIVTGLIAAKAFEPTYTTSGGATAVKAYLPVNDFYISSPFGWRTLPGLGYHLHAGTDYRPRAGVGAPVFALYGYTIEKIISSRANGQSSSSGAVLAPGRSGNGIFGRCADNEGVMQAHVKPLSTLRVGQWVAPGTLIGHVDMSGITSGPHTHTEIWTNASNSNSCIDVAARLEYHRARGELGTGTTAVSPVPATPDNDLEDIMTHYIIEKNGRQYWVNFRDWTVRYVEDRGGDLGKSFRAEIHTLVKAGGDVLLDWRDRPDAATDSNVLSATEHFRYVGPADFNPR